MPFREIKNTADDIKIHLMKKRKFIDIALLLLSSIDVLILVHLLYSKRRAPPPFHAPITINS